jgi:cell division protein FtsW
VSKAAPLPKNRAVAKAEPPAPAKPALTQPISELLRSSPDGPVDSVLAAAVIIALDRLWRGDGLLAPAPSKRRRAPGRPVLPQAPGRLCAARASSRCGSTSRLDYRRLKALAYPMLFTVAGMLVITVIGFGHRAGNADSWLTVGPDPHPAGRARPSWRSSCGSRTRSRRRPIKIKSFSVGFVPHLFVCRRASCGAVSEAARLRQLCRPPLSHLHDALRRGRSRPRTSQRSPCCSGHGGRQPPSASASTATPYVAVARHGVATANGFAYQPFQSVMSFGSGETRAARPRPRSCRCSTCPRLTPTSSARSSARSSGSSGSSCSARRTCSVVSRGVKVALEAGDDYGSLPRLRHRDHVRRAGADQPLRWRWRSCRRRGSRCPSSATAARRSSSTPRPSACSVSISRPRTQEGRRRAKKLAGRATGAEQRAERVRGRSLTKADEGAAEVGGW